MTIYELIAAILTGLAAILVSKWKRRTFAFLGLAVYYLGSTHPVVGQAVHTAALALHHAAICAACRS